MLHPKHQQQYLWLGLGVLFDRLGLSSPYSGTGGTVLGLEYLRVCCAVPGISMGWSIDSSETLSTTSPGSLSSSVKKRGCNCSQCRLQTGPWGTTLTLKQRVPNDFLTIAGTQRGCLCRRGPWYSAYTGSPALNCLVTLATPPESGVIWDFEASLDCLPCAVCAGDGSSESILVRNCLEFNSSLGEKPQDVGVLRYCIRNSRRARFGGREDFLSACLKVCTKRSAATW